MKLRYVNLLWFVALVLSWLAFYLAFSVEHAANQFKLNGLRGRIVELEKENEELRRPK